MMYLTSKWLKFYASIALVLVLAFSCITTFIVTKAAYGIAKSRAVGSSLPDTTENIHVGMSFNYNVSNPSSEAGKVDYVWGSDYANQPPGVYNTQYEPFDREPRGTSHDLAWFQANHPDWIEYQCDKSSVAYEFGDPNVPLDITNPAVLQYLLQTYYAPALSEGYAGIAFDNGNLNNQQGHRCGVFRNGAWVQEFSGNSDDSAYHSAILQWAQWMSGQVHALGGSFNLNFSYDFSDPTDSNALLQMVDVLADERGFTNWGGSSSNYLTENDWLANMQALEALNSQGKALFSINEEPNSFATLTQNEVQWVLANYLLVKGAHSYVEITGTQEYGSLFLRPEYSAPVGHAVNAMYFSQGVYMRDFSNGKAIVNPSASQSFLVPLPTNSYTDLYGNNPGGTVTIPPDSGIVLVGPPPVSGTPSVTPTPIVTDTPVSTPTMPIVGPTIVLSSDDPLVSFESTNKEQVEAGLVNQLEVEGQG